MRVYDAQPRLTEGDLRELRELLEHSERASEAELRGLLLARPALLRSLDFVAFATEVALHKWDESGEAVDEDRRRVHRADVVAARQSPIRSAAGEPVFTTHLVELKAPKKQLLRRVGTGRLSEAVCEGLEQLDDYSKALTEIPGNRARMKAVGWTVTAPGRYLIAGSEREFIGRARDLDVVRAKVHERGAHLVTTEDLLRAAERLRGAEAFEARVSVVASADEPLLVVNAGTHPIVDLTGRERFPEALPDKPQERLSRDEWNNSSLGGLSVSEKYLFQATAAEQSLVRAAGAEHIERLFNGLWSDACASLDSTPLIGADAHSRRSRAIWIGAVAARGLGLEEAWLRWHRSRMAPPVRVAPKPVKSSSRGTMWGLNCVCGAEYDLDPDYARQLASFRCRRCQRELLPRSGR